MITIYELLGLIKDGKAPKKIKYKGHIYTYQYNDNREANIINYYHSDETHHHLIDGGWHDIRLNDEVEIIEEEKEIEKIIINSQGNIEKKLIDGSTIVLPTNKDETLHIAYKLNDLIDEINKLKKGAE